MKCNLFFLLLLLSLNAKAGLQRLKLSDALRMNIVSVTATGKGGYTGQALQLKITNNSGNPLLLTVDPALIFRPVDTSQQDLLLAGNEKISVQPFKNAEAAVQTFCAKSYAGSPRAGEAFSFLKQGGDTLQQVIDFMRNNNLLFSPLAQKAVWVLTNEHSIATVYEPALHQQSLRLTEFLSQLLGQPQPDVYVIHGLNNEPGQPVFQPKALSMVALFEEKQETPRKLTLGVFDQEGNMIQPVFEDRMFGKGGHRFKVAFDAKNVSAGPYYIRLKSGDEVLQEKSVVVD